jgi:phosphate transport system ATP-binding protein
MAVIEVRDLDFFYGKFQALNKISLDIEQNRITALIGPSGCGKTTFLRALNRMTDLIDDVRVTGTVLIDGQNIYKPGVDLLDLRKKVGMVFQRPNPFPLSVFDNVVYGPRVHGLRNPKDLEARLIRSLEAVHLWDELKDRLDENALGLSGEQQLKKRYTIVIVTHNMQQAARVSDVTGYFLLGELVEIGETRRIFTAPKDFRTEDYITGRFG